MEAVSRLRVTIYFTGTRAKLDGQLRDRAPVAVAEGIFQHSENVVDATAKLSANGGGVRDTRAARCLGSSFCGDLLPHDDGTVFQLRARVLR